MLGSGSKELQETTAFVRGVAFLLEEERLEKAAARDLLRLEEAFEMLA